MTQFAIPLPSTTSFAADDFVVSDCNRLAHHHILQWPQWDTPWLWIYGPPASGKSHLGAIFAARAQAGIGTPQQVQGDPADLFGGAHALVLDGQWDDLDEDAMFHVLNYCKSHPGLFLLCLAEMPPARVPVRLPDLRSRLNALPAIPIEQPDDALLEAVMMKQLSDRQMLVSPEVIRYTLRHIDRSCASVAAMVARMDKKSLESNRKITLPFVRELLEM